MFTTSFDHNSCKSLRQKIRKALKCFQVRFHSMHVATCSSFAIDLDSSSVHKSFCLKDHPTANESRIHSTIDHDTLEKYAQPLQIPKGVALKLSPRGYR